MLIRVPKDSDQWHELRWGRVTASRFGDVMARHDTKRYKTYQHTIMNAMLGYETPEISLPWHEIGTVNEPLAIAEYERQYECKVDQDIFYIHDEHEWLSATPDGHVVGQEDKLVEVKTRHTWETFEAACLEPPKGDYKAQIQGQMLIAKAKSCDYVNLFVTEDGEPIIDVRPINPDHRYFELLENACADFYLVCLQLVQEIAA